jgi:hypothetical protein
VNSVQRVNLSINIYYYSRAIVEKAERISSDRCCSFEGDTVCLSFSFFFLPLNNISFYAIDRVSISAISSITVSATEWMGFI